MCIILVADPFLSICEPKVDYMTRNGSLTFGLRELPQAFTAIHTVLLIESFDLMNPPLLSGGGGRRGSKTCHDNTANTYDLT